MINNRQAGRRRGRGGQRSQGGNPGRGPDNGNRIDNRARGNASQLLEKYKTLARDAQMQGDRVNTEYYLQFADHYFRVLSESRSRFDENQNRRPQNDQFEEGDEEDFDSEMIADDVRDAYPADNRNGREQNGREQNGRDQQPRDRDGNREYSRDGVRGEGRGGRDNRAQRDGNRDGRDGGRDYAQQAERSYEERDRDGEVVAPQGNGATEDARPVEADRPRRGRPRREAGPVAQHDDQDHGPVAIEADRLPPALSATASDDESAEKPRRRRGRPPAEVVAAD